MAVKDGGNIDAEIEAWNVAQGFVHVKILKLMVEADKYERIAKFGVEELDQDAMLSPSQLAKRRVDAINMYLFCLKQLIGNVEFTIKQKDGDLIKTYKESIELVEEFIDGVYTSSINQIKGSSTTTINEDHMKKCLDILKSVKDGLNSPMNRAGLIFRETDEIDINKIMQDIETGG